MCYRKHKHYDTLGVIYNNISPIYTERQGINSTNQKKTKRNKFTTNNKRNKKHRNPSNNVLYILH